jgi:hypothetical protein
MVGFGRWAKLTEMRGILHLPDVVFQMRNVLPRALQYVQGTVIEYSGEGR